MKFNDVVKVIKPGFYENAMGTLIKVTHIESDDSKPVIGYTVKLHSNNTEQWFRKEELVVVL